MFVLTTPTACVSVKGRFSQSHQKGTIVLDRESAYYRTARRSNDHKTDLMSAKTETTSFSTASLNVWLCADSVCDITWVKDPLRTPQSGSELQEHKHFCISHVNFQLYSWDARAAMFTHSASGVWPKLRWPRDEYHLTHTHGPNERGLWIIQQCRCHDEKYNRRSRGAL